MNSSIDFLYDLWMTLFQFVNCEDIEDSVKVMSRYTKWIVLIILLLALDFSRLIDAVGNIFTQKPNIRL
ncbi:hypothetical protein MCO_01805 [Bartonella sp. DB5-6]|uniref:hypothetical protein n=1 Tax=Bartonella sp. DB5-6 TaxID=1094755 RepID=UPI00026E9D12|nr:hypothetical protein [Bartonella sp. DB5-6]EJF75521.1 hypothetical protein MCO_01805 [Bartonella sp. DB5-6]